MSIRPVQIAPLALPPPQASRTAEPAAPAPDASAQTGASALGMPVVPASTVSGTTSALNVREPGDAVRAAEARPTDPKELAEALKQAQDVVDVHGRDLSFSVHEKTGEVVVRIIDRESKEVIKQIPAEEMLRIAERLQELEGENKPGLLLKQEV